jgi:hypothetical protein
MQCDFTQQYVYDAFNTLVYFQPLFAGVQSIFNLLKFEGESLASISSNACTAGAYCYDGS